MAKYFDDFTANDIGTAPAGWTTRTNTMALEVVADAEATGGKALKIGPGSALVQHSFVSFDAVTADANRADFEVLVRSRATNTNAGGQNLCGAAGRVFTTSTASSGFNGYTVGRRYTGWRDRLISTVSGGTTTILGTTAGTTVAAEVYAFGRFRVLGTTLQYRSWSGALEDEPATWEVETTNSTYSGAGWVGIWRNLLTNDVHVDFVGVGTGGDAAPSGPVGGANTQVTTSPGTLTVSGSAPSSAFSGTVTSAPGVGALTITPQAAEILFSGTVDSESQPGSLSLVPQAPQTTLSGAITSAPEPGLLDLTGHPSQSAFSGAITSATLPGSLAFSGLAGQIIVSGAATVTVLTAAGALSLTGAAPSAAYSGTMRAQTLPGLLALAGVAPSLLHSGAVTVELLAGQLSIDGQAVETTIGGGIRVQTAAGLLSLLGDAPSVVISGGVRVETQPGTMALTGAAPVMIHAGLIEIVTAAGGLSIAGLPVTVSAGERLGPIFAPGLHSITVQRAVLSVTPIRGLRRFDGH